MEDKVSRAKAIRLKCLDCSGGNSAEVRRCPATNCALWPYRMGRVKLSENTAKTQQESANLERVS